MDCGGSSEIFSVTVYYVDRYFGNQQNEKGNLLSCTTTFTVLRMPTDDSLFSVADPVQFFKPQEYILGHYLAGEPFQGCMAGRLLNTLLILLILFILSVFSSLAICISDINFLNSS